MFNDEIEKKLRFKKQTFNEPGPKASEILAKCLRMQQITISTHKIGDSSSNNVL